MSSRGRWRRRLLLPAALVAAIAASGFALTLGDPLAALPVPHGAATVAQIEEHADVAAKRRVAHVTLTDPSLGRIAFTVSLPDPLPQRKLPLVLVLGGLGTGEHNMRYVIDPGDNALLGYDWPIPTRFSEVSGLAETLSLRGRVLAMPGQVAALLDWAAAQSWSDPGRISLIGFSLGAVAGPAIARVAAAHGHPIGWTVLAYGGAPLSALARGDQRIHPAWVRPLIGIAAETVLHPIEPAAHLPALTGHFLLVTGSGDDIVSEAASQRLIDLTPLPKTVLVLPGGHVGTGAGREALIVAAITATRRWLASQGAINGP